MGGSGMGGMRNKIKFVDRCDGGW